MLYKPSSIYNKFLDFNNYFMLIIIIGDFTNSRINF